jgi:hypothetical protein
MSDERVDATIDEVAREMTRGELPPDFRDRVIARLERGDARHRSWRPALVLAPLAVTAVVLLAILVDRPARRSDGPADVRQDVRAQIPGDVALKPMTIPGQAVGGLNTEVSRTPPRVSSAPDPRYARGADGGRSQIASDLAPAPIEITSLEVEAMEPTDVAPLSVDGMESIDVPGLDVAPLEVPAIGEE